MRTDLNEKRWTGIIGILRRDLNQATSGIMHWGIDTDALFETFLILKMVVEI